MSNAHDSGVGSSRRSSSSALLSADGRYEVERLLSLQLCMSPVPLPENVLANWRNWSSDQAESVIANAQDRLATAIDAWQLTDLAPMPGGEVALVLVATSPAGEAVLKVNPNLAGDTDVLATEPRALALWSGAGAAPQVYATRDNGLTMLLQRVRPGTTLREATTDAMSIVGTLGGLCRVVHQHVDPQRFCRLADGSEANGWRRELAGTREHDELERLLKPSSDDRLLHTDLHCINAGQADAPGRWSAQPAHPACAPRAPGRRGPSTPPASAVRHWLRSRAARVPDPGRDPTRGRLPRRAEIRVRRATPQSDYPATRRRSPNTGAEGALIHTHRVMRAGMPHASAVGRGSRSRDDRHASAALRGPRQQAPTRPYADQRFMNIG